MKIGMSVLIVASAIISQGTKANASNLLVLNEETLWSGNSDRVRREILTQLKKAFLSLELTHKKSGLDFWFEGCTVIVITRHLAPAGQAIMQPPPAPYKAAG